MTALDDRYVEFRDRTAHVFATHPDAEPLRHHVFKELLIRRKGRGRVGSVASWLRSRLRQPRSNGSLQQSGVLIWLESSRREFVDTLLPVSSELAETGIDHRLVAWSSREDLPAETHRVYPRQRWTLPSWAKTTWRDLVKVEPSLAEPPLERAFLGAVRQLDGLYREIGRVFDEVRPSVVVNANSILTGGAALAVVARKREAASFSMQHGIPQAFYAPVVDDFMLTWGETSSTVLGGVGVTETQLIEVGSPRHDAMSRPPSATAKQALVDNLGLHDGPIVVFFSNGNDFDRNGSAPKECAEWLEAAAAGHPGVNIVVRLHPNEDGSLYENRSHLTITKGVPSLDVTLAGADIVGSLCSTVLYEALLYGRAVWQFYANGWPELANNWRQGLALRVASDVELGSLLGRIACGELPGLPSSRAVDRVFANRGSAAKVTASVIADSLESCSDTNSSPDQRLVRGSNRSSGDV